MRRLRLSIRTDPRCSEQLAALEAMARDAGVEITEDDDFWFALRSHELFDDLLAAEGWDHPAEVLDEDGELEAYFDELVCVAHARVRQEADSERLAAIREKLERAQAAKRGEDDLVEDFARRLLAYTPATAQHLLLRAGREVELRRKEREPRSKPAAGHAEGGD